MGASHIGRAVVCAVRDAQWERRSGEAEETPQNLAKTKRSPSEALANNTLSTPDPCAVTTLLAGLEVAGSAGVGAAEHSRKEQADAKVPAWLINRAQPSVAGTDFPDDPMSQPFSGLSGSTNATVETLRTMTSLRGRTAK